MAELKLTKIDWMAKKTHLRACPNPANKKRARSAPGPAHSLITVTDQQKRLAQRARIPAANGRGVVVRSSSRLLRLCEIAAAVVAVFVDDRDHRGHVETTAAPAEQQRQPEVLLLLLIAEEGVEQRRRLPAPGMVVDQLRLFDATRNVDSLLVPAKLSSFGVYGIVALNWSFGITAAFNNLYTNRQ